MSKKAYTAPNMEQTNIELGNMLAASVNVGIHTNQTMDASQSLSNERRGWGDLWNNGNE